MLGTTISLACASHFVMFFISQCVMCSVGRWVIFLRFTAYNMYHFTVYNVYHWTIMHVLLLINVYRRPKRDSRLLCFGIYTLSFAGFYGVNTPSLENSHSSCAYSNIPSSSPNIANTFSLGLLDYYLTIYCRCSYRFNHYITLYTIY